MAEFFQGGYYFRWDGRHNRHSVDVLNRAKCHVGHMMVRGEVLEQPELDDVHEAIELYIEKYGRSNV